jgi:hypothetical protein
MTIAGTEEITTSALQFGAGTFMVDDLARGGTLAGTKLDVAITRYDAPFDNARGSVKGAQVITKVEPSLTIEIAELAAAKLSWALPGSALTPVQNAVYPVGGASTLVATPGEGATAATSSQLYVASVTGIVPGDILEITKAAHLTVHEYAQVLTAVDTTDTPINHLITFTAPLIGTYAAADVVKLCLLSDDQVLNWTPGILSDSDYHTIVFEGPGMDGRMVRITLYNAIADGNLAVEFSSKGFSSIPIKFIATYDPATPTTAPFKIEFLSPVVRL